MELADIPDILREIGDNHYWVTTKAGKSVSIPKHACPSVWFPDDPECKCTACKSKGSQGTTIK